jgi:hypothetical protein
MNRYSKNTIRQTMDLIQFSAQELKEILNTIEDTENEHINSSKKIATETTPKALSRLYETSEMIRNSKSVTFKLFEIILDFKNQVYIFKQKEILHTLHNNIREVITDNCINKGRNNMVIIDIEKVKSYISSLSMGKKTTPMVENVFNLQKRQRKFKRLKSFGTSKLTTNLILKN